MVKFMKQIFSIKSDYKYVNVIASVKWILSQ